MTEPAFARIACIGEVMIEIMVTGEASAALNVAGDTYNTAVYLSRLLAGQGVAVSYVTALGADSFSDRALAHMTREGIGTAHVERRADRQIGLYAIETDASGERSFAYWRGESAARGLFAPPRHDGLDVLEEVDMVYLSGITLAILPAASRTALMAALDDFRARGGCVAYDSNHRPRLWEGADVAREVNRAMWARTDIALPSVDDEMLIWQDPSPDAALDRLRGYALRCGALKRGPQGPLSLDPDAPPEHFAPVAEVIDTTAAGDSFNAGYLSRIALGDTPARALRTGHAVASQVIQARGAIVPVRLGVQYP